MIANELRLAFSAVGFGKFHCDEMRQSNKPYASHFDPDFPMLDSSTAPKTHEWYRHSLINTAIDNSSIDFALLEEEAPTLIVFVDLSIDAGALELKNDTVCSASFSSLLLVLHTLHPRALIVVSKAMEPVVSQACQLSDALCDTLLVVEDYYGSCNFHSSGDYGDQYLAECEQELGINYHPSTTGHRHIARRVLQQLRSDPRFDSEPLLAEPQAAATSLLARDRSPVLSGDLVARWRYLPRDTGPTCPITIFGRPLTLEADEYCDATEGCDIGAGSTVVGAATAVHAR